MRESSGLSLGYPVKLLIDRLRRPQVMVGIRAGKVAGRSAAPLLILASEPKFTQFSGADPWGLINIQHPAPSAHTSRLLQTLFLLSDLTCQAEELELCPGEVEGP